MEAGQEEGDGEVRQMRELAEIVLRDGGRGSRVCAVQEEAGGALEIRLDLLELADQFPSLAYWLCGDPVGFVACLARALSSGEAAPPLRVNILPSVLPWSPTSTISGQATGQLAAVCGTVVGVEGHRNPDGGNEVWSRTLACRRCLGEPFVHLEGDAHMSCPHCGSGEAVLMEDVALQTLVACKYVALALERPEAALALERPEAAPGDASLVRRVCIVRLQDSLSRLAVGLGTRLQVIGVPLVVDSSRHTSSLEKIAGVSTAKHESESDSKTIFFAWSVRVKTHFPTLLLWKGQGSTLPRSLARKRQAPGPYDSPMPVSFNRRIVAAPPSNMSFASDMDAYLVPDAEEMEEAALQLNRVLEAFLPLLPYWRLRLSVLLALVSGNPLIPIDSAQVAGRAKAMRDNVHLLVRCGSDSLRVTGQILQAAKKASILPSQCIHAGLQPTFVVDKSKTSWRIETSVLLQANGGTAFVHDLAAITNKSDQTAMASCLSSQTITVVKEQCTATVPCLVSFIAVIPPETMRKKEPPAEWLRHFDLAIVINDTPDDALESALSAALLDTSAEQPQDMALSEWLLASSHTLVFFSQDAHCLLTAFYKATRKAMAHCNGNHYQIQPITRIASAIAKLRQAQAVEMPDVVLAVSLNEETRVANGLTSALNFQVLANGKSNTELMHGEFCEALVKLSVRVFNLCYEYGTLTSEE